MIEFDDVSMAYPDGTVAADHVGFQVPDRSTTVLIGPSGAGKTTLLRMVNRMVNPTSGRVLVDGVDVATVDAVALRRSIGYVLQAGGLLPHRTVVDNVATVPRLNGIPRREARSRAVAMLELVGLEARLADRYPAELSGGQQQRVGVARALAAEPDVLLMDEQFGAVDPIVRRELQAELRRLQTELGKTILLVTHDVDEAFALADQIVVLRAGGQVAQIAAPTDLLLHPVDAFVASFIGSGGAERSLEVRDVDGAAVVVDRDGRLLGRLGP